MGRRAPGDGSVYFDGSRGVYVGAIDLGRDLDTGRRMRRKVSGATRREVRSKLDELRQEHRKTGTVGRQDVTVERIMRDLLDAPPAAWRSPITMDVNTRHVNRVIEALGKVRVVKLTPGEVERMLRKLARDGLSTYTISATRAVLARAIRRAQRDGLVGRNVAELAETPHGTRRISQALTLEQIGQLFGSDLAPWWRAYLTTGILCGLRPGELLGLRWQDIDFDGGALRVRKALHQQRDPATGKIALVLADLKTKQSKRTLALPAAAAVALRAHRTAQTAERLRLGRHYADHGLVFCGTAGQPCWRQDTNRAFKRICSAADIPGDWHPHELRHTFVSVLSDAGVDIDAIADSAGHSSANVTRTVYRHVIADKLTTAAEAMDRIFGQVSGS